MQKLWYAIILIILLTQNCPADTFTNKITGAAFNGYATQVRQGRLTLVYKNGEKDPQYLNLSDYQITSNFLGRKEKVYVFSFKKAIELECETIAFEKAIAVAANHGPQFILINIDTPGGRTDLTTRICTAIVATTNCPVVAYISGGEFGGAYSAGAIIAMACDKIIMAEGTAIGAATQIISSASGSVKSAKQAFGEVVGEKFDSAWRGYCISVAETSGRPAALVKAMIDKETEVVEVVDNGKNIFIESNDKKEAQAFVRVVNKKGSILTLSAEQAICCGIADIMAKSQKDAAALMGAKNTRFALDQELIRARHAYENATKILKEIRNNTDFLTKNLEAVGQDLSSTTKNYNTEVANYNKSVELYNSGYYSYDTVKSQKDLLMSIENAIGRLSRDYNQILNSLIANYRKVIALKKINIDLDADIEDLQKAINSANSLYR